MQNCGLAVGKSIRSISVSLLSVRTYSASCQCHRLEAPPINLSPVQYKQTVRYSDAVQQASYRYVVAGGRVMKTASGNQSFGDEVFPPV
jgi:hypothetical protein